MLSGSCSKYKVNELKKIAEQNGIRLSSKDKKANICRKLASLFPSEFDPSKCLEYSVNDIKAYAKKEDISLAKLTKKSQYCDKILSDEKETIVMMHDRSSEEKKSAMKSKSHKEKLETDCESKTVKQIRAFAKKKKISLLNMTRKSQFCAAIDEWKKSRMVKEKSPVARGGTREDEKGPAERTGTREEEKKELNEAINLLSFIHKKAWGDTTWEGTGLNEFLGSIYLLGKHNNVCIVKPSTANHRDAYQIVWNCTSQKLYFPKNLFQVMLTCKKRFFAIPLTLRSCDASPTGHANYMIYDTKLKTLERFEPHGRRSSSRYSPELLDLKFKILCQDYNIDYLNPRDICFRKAFQAIQRKEEEKKVSDPVGWCSAWALFYADLRLTHPDYPQNKLIQDALDQFKQSPFSLTAFIRDYVEVLQELKDFIDLKMKGRDTNSKISFVLNNFESFVKMANDMFHNK